MFEVYFDKIIILTVICVIVKFIFNTKKDPPTVTSKIKPIDDSFKWELTPPYKYRPFVGKKNFNPNMAISNLAKTPEDWLLIENTYKEITATKKKLVSQYPDHTLSAYDNPRSRLAVEEYYIKVFDFMVQRYPQYFKKNKKTIDNLINGESIPIDVRNIDSIQLLKILAANTEEDVVIFLKDNPKNEDEEYILRASITGFPQGFDPSHHHNKPISFIHEPVPQYQSRLKLSMGRFFNRLEASDLWVRYNWSIQTHKNHFSLESNHAYGNDTITQLKYEDIDFDSGCFLRCERQCLTRLPKLRANMMSVRTYVTPIKHIKQEGLSESLCYAIDSLPEDLAFYKRRPAWGEAVKQYLRE